MSRTNFRRSLRLESLESRELLTAGGPSSQQQYMLYLLNQARTNPVQMAQRVTSNLNSDVTATLKYYNVNLQAVKDGIASTPAKPPLAWNDRLANAAQGQSQYQSDTGTQSHTGANGSDLQARLDQAGYSNRSSAGENAYAYSDSVDQAMEAFLIDWGVASNGHRNNILQPNTSSDDSYRDVGIGIVGTNKPGFGPNVITQDFGAQQGEKAQLVGVAFNDPQHTKVYAPGSGQGNVTIQARNDSTGATSTVQTWDAGGYQLPLDPGNYEVTALVGDQVVRSQQVQIGSVNVEVDYDLSDPWQAPAPVAKSTVTSPPVVPPAPPTTPSITAVTHSSPSQSGTPNTDASWSSSWTSWTAAKKS